MDTDTDTDSDTDRDRDLIIIYLYPCLIYANLWLKIYQTFNMPEKLPFKISTLIFIENDKGELLLMKRLKNPNFGLYSCIGGKLEMDQGESPFECAIREVQEEIKVNLTEKDLHLFCMITEKNYENNGHWLMFLFNCKKSINQLPENIDEGEFAFISKDELKKLPIPETDRRALWPIYEKHKDSFVVLRADCRTDEDLNIVFEQIS